MSLFLKALPIFPFVDKQLVIETVNNTKNNGLFNLVIIEHIYRIIFEIVLLQILWHFREKKSKIRDMLERIGISLGLILWNYFELSTSVVKAAIGPPSFIFFQFGYYLCCLAHAYLGNIAIVSLLIIAARKKSIYIDEKKNSFYKLYIQTLIFRSLIDGRLFGFVLSNTNVLIAEENKFYSFSVLIMSAFLLFKWIIRIIDEMIELFHLSPIIILMIFGKTTKYCCVNTTLCSRVIKERLNKPTKTYRITQYYGYIKNILTASSIIDLALVLLYVLNSSINNGSSNSLIVLNKFCELGTLPLMPLWWVCSRISRANSNLNCFYVCCDGEEETDENQGKNGDKDIASV